MWWNRILLFICKKKTRTICVHRNEVFEGRKLWTFIACRYASFCAYHRILFTKPWNTLKYKNCHNLTLTFKVDLRVNMKSESYFCHVIWIWKKTFEIPVSYEVIRDWPLFKNEWLIITKVKVKITIFEGINILKHIHHFSFCKHLKIPYHLIVRKIWPWPLRLTLE